MINYNDILKEIRNFRSPRKTDIWDSPAGYYFKVVFYFNGVGLLGTDNIGMNPSDVATAISNIRSKMTGMKDLASIRTKWKDLNYKDTAFNFLCLNGEWTRAQLLNQFIITLSNLSSDTPWYFHSISGLGELMEKEQKMMTRDVKMDEEDGKITIECLPDSIDERIGTLIDMYKEICYNEEMKRVILPVNLRRFDMGIYIFQKPTKSLHGRFTPTTGGDGGYARIDKKICYDLWNGNGNNQAYTSFKYFELRDCEINIPETIKSAWGDAFTQEEPKALKSSLIINVRTMKEIRFNAVIGETIGDLLRIDLGDKGSYVDKGLAVDTTSKSDIEARTGYFETGFKNVREGSNELSRNGQTGLRPLEDDELEVYNGVEVMPKARLEDEYNPYTGSIVSGLSKLGNKIADSLTLPSLNIPHKNFADSGTVYRKGPYDWLRYVGLGGLAGQVVAQGIGTGIAELQKLPGYQQMESLTLGNLNGESVNSVLSKAFNFLGGDVSGTSYGIANDAGVNNTEEPQNSIANKSLHNQTDTTKADLPLTGSLHGTVKVAKVSEKLQQRNIYRNL